MKRKGRNPLLKKRKCEICGQWVENCQNHHTQYFPIEVKIPVCIPDHNWLHGLNRNLPGNKFRRKCKYCGELIWMCEIEGGWTPFKIDGSERHSCKKKGQLDLF